MTTKARKQKYKDALWFMKDATFAVPSHLDPNVIKKTILRALRKALYSERRMKS